MAGYSQCGPPFMASKKKTPLVKFSLTLGRETFSGEGQTITEALKNMPRPNWIKSKGVVSVVAGDKSFTQTMLPVRLRRLFIPSFQHIHAKILERLVR